MPQQRKETNFMQVGKLQECGHCNSKFAAGLLELEGHIRGYKCDCVCHDSTPHSRKEEMLREEFFMKFSFAGAPLDNVSGVVLADVCNFWLSKMKQDRDEMMGRIKALKTDERKVADFGDYEARTYNEKVLVNAVLDKVLSILNPDDKFGISLPDNQEGR